MFFEPSTRTRLSFETAANRLGAKVIGFSDAATSSATKGETLKDTIMMVSSYADVIAMRHKLEGAARYASEVSQVPIINAGDGANQHPSQTLLDLYSILQTQGTLEGLTINMVGDLKYGRTTHSLLQAMSHFNPRFIFTSPDELKMPQEYKDFLNAKGIPFTETKELEGNINTNTGGGNSSGDIDLSNYYTKEEINNKLETVVNVESLETYNFASESWVTANYQPKGDYQPAGNYLTYIPSEYVTESELETRLEGIGGGGGDLSQFVEQTAASANLYPPTTEGWTNSATLNSSGVITSNTKNNQFVTPQISVEPNTTYTVNDVFGWIKNGTCQPVLYITTEQELEEIQTMMLAFLSNVNEEHILNGEYEEGEEERIMQAAKLLKESPIYVEELPDFSLQDVENKIKKNIREHDVKYVFHDYIHTSLKILEEITKRSGGVKLREDNILFMLSTRLKDICNQHGVFIMSATQLNGDYQDSKTPDQNLLRGAKAIADKIDYGAILLNVKDEDLVKLDKILSTNVFDRPSIKMSVYKNRRGRYKGIYLWCKADLGCCRIKPMFATTYDYEIIPIDDMKIVLEDESAF